jgi:hypothetical protein
MLVCIFMSCEGAAAEFYLLTDRLLTYLHVWRIAALQRKR